MPGSAAIVCATSALYVTDNYSAPGPGLSCNSPDFSFFLPLDCAIPAVLTQCFCSFCILAPSADAGVVRFWWAEIDGASEAEGCLPHAICKEMSLVSIQRHQSMAFIKMPDPCLPFAVPVYKQTQRGFGRHQHALGCYRRPAARKSKSLFPHCD